MADKRQLNLNHEYERTEREGGQDGGVEWLRERERRGETNVSPDGNLVVAL